MAPRITKLTPEQEAILPLVRDEWLAHGLSTEPADRAAAEEGVRMAYRAAGLEPPRFMIWLGSPWAGVIGQAIAPEIVAEALRRAKRGGQVDDQVYDQVRDQVRGQVDDQVYDQVRDQVRGQVRDQVDDQVRGQVYDQVRDQVYGQVDDQVYGQVYGQVGDQVRDQVYGQVGDQVRDQVYGQVGRQVKERLQNWWRGRLAGQHWAGYYSWLDAMERIGVTGLEPIHGQQQVARTSGWWWAFRDFAILTERPAELHRDQLGRLHCETGPAIRYPDGWSIHAWHGRRVPAWVVDDPSIARITAETNAEIRRCGIESLGWPKFIAEAGLTAVDTTDDPGNPGQTITLYDVPRNLWGASVRVLVCTNGTVERDRTRRSFGLTVPANTPTALAAAGWGYGLTAEEYAAAQRRS